MVYAPKDRHSDPEVTDAKRRKLAGYGSTHFCRIRDGSGAGRPPHHHHQYFSKDETDPNKLDMIGKGI